MVIVSNSFCFVNRKKEKSQYIFLRLFYYFLCRKFLFSFWKEERKNEE